MSEQRKRIFIVDDHQMVIDGLRLMIEGFAGFEIVGECNHPEQVPEILKTISVDILLTDVSMPVMSGIELTRQVKKLFPRIKVLTLSMFGDSQVITEMVDAGVSGYILKNTGMQELLEALTRISAGQNYFANEITMQLTRSFKQGHEESRLTDREIEIIRMIEKDLNNKQIAGQLFISERTVETHRKNILRKTSTQTVVGLLKYAYERKII